MQSRSLLILCLLCGLLLAARTRPSRPPETPTFNREVVRIFQQNCQNCHHAGDIAPFPLMTYQDARPYADDIQFMTERRRMPPWKPSADCSIFRGERRLAESDIETIRRWVGAGAPEGNPADLPEPLHFESDWELGTPDTILKPSESFTPEAGHDVYRCYSLPAGLDQDRFVTAIDVHPGSRHEVHHVIAFIDSTAVSERLDAAEPGPGYTCFGGPGFTPTGSLGGWAPGARAARLPEGIAISLPKGSRVVLQVHYHPHDAQPDSDLTELGIYYARSPVRQQLYFLPIVNNTFVLPAGEEHQTVTASLQLPYNVYLHAINVTPHMHLLGRKMKVEAISPSGETRCLIDIEDWDFNWQGTYAYDESVPLPGSTRLEVTAEYDNSSRNLRNPNQPPRDVRWGEQTTDEMCIAFVGVTLDTQALNSTSSASWEAEWLLQTFARDMTKLRDRN
ncbi:MAG TPA: ascorbate-dependent monooxygenase [Thermoanaerobaculia bacterium]|nr:ascorbate-dependent monooxygenase [Thermoanaerobaculia bacterium]